MASVLCNVDFATKRGMKNGGFEKKKSTAISLTSKKHATLLQVSTRLYARF